MQRPIQPVYPDTEQHAAERGFMLLAVVVMVALVLIALAVAAPQIAKDLRRDKEVESEHRAQQYVRAIRLYYRKFKSYPPSMDALQKSNNVRFLRKEYVDPLTGDTNWRLIHVGENQTTVKGFFGEPLGGLNTSGIGAGSSNIGSSIGGTSGTPGTASGTATIGQTSALGAGFSGATVGTPGSGGTSGTGGTGSSSSSSFGSGGVGQIMGVGSARGGNSILTPNQQTTYDTWEFLYDPRIELLYQKSNILGGGIGGTSATSFGGNGNIGQPIGTGLPGSTSPGGTSGAPATPPTTGTPVPQ